MDFEAGHEIFMFYGYRSNFELFTFAGFTQQNLDYDAFETTFHLPLPEHDPKHQEKITALKSSAMDGRGLRIRLSRDYFRQKCLSDLMKSPLFIFVSIVAGSQEPKDIINYIKIRLTVLMKMALCKEDNDLPYKRQICRRLKLEEASICRDLISDIGRLLE